MFLVAVAVCRSGESSSEKTVLRLASNNLLGIIQDVVLILSQNERQVPIFGVLPSVHFLSIRKCVLVSQDVSRRRLRNTLWCRLPRSPLTRNQASRGKGVPVLRHHLLGREHPRLQNADRILRHHVTLARDYEGACKSFALGLSGPCGVLEDRVESDERRALLEGHRLVCRVGFGRPHHHRQLIRGGGLRRAPAQPGAPEVARRGGLRQARARERAAQSLRSLDLFLLLLPPRSR